MQRRIERRLVPSRASMKPVALQDTVVQSGVRILVVRVGAMERPICRGAVLLPPIRLEKRPVLTVAQGHLFASADRD